jgi:hypothetical protein
MHVRALSVLSSVPSLCLVLFSASSALAQGPEWFDPEPPKPAPEATKVEAPKVPGKGEAPGASESKAGTPEAAPKADKAAPKTPAEPVEARPCIVAPAPPAKPAVGKEARVTTKTEWYGWETAIMDAAAFGAFLSGVDERDSSMAVAGVGLYLLGAPVVHGFKGQWGKAGASLGLRLGAPVAGAFTGAMLASGSCRRSGPEDLCGASAVVSGFLLGALVPPLVDAIFLGKKEVPVKTASFSWQPTVVPVREGVSFGLAGTF